jgi:hypothetical protein
MLKFAFLRECLVVQFRDFLGARSEDCFAGAFSRPRWFVIDSGDGLCIPKATLICISIPDRSHSHCHVSNSAGALIVWRPDSFNI